ncbi:MAG TPA: zinc-binding dehydrogenase [Pseudonocardia sp.]|nr:zinc-binding dehydrogenase [Pseudonocardia sp.]
MVRQFGGPEQLRVEQLPDPTPGAGEVLLAVGSAGVNRADVLTRAGQYHRAGRPPLRLGLEGAGTVVAVGAGVTDVVVGQRVVAMGAVNEPGFYADLAVVAASRVTPVPEGLPLTTAAALPTAWLSAWYCLRRLAGLRAGETVLIPAAASGVGSAAVRIAVDLGATVIGTARSAAKVAWVRELGAHHALDTATLDGAGVLAEVAGLTGGRGVDVVLDTVGGQTFADGLRAVGYAGRVVALANVAVAPSTVDTRDFYPKNARILGFQLNGLIEHGYDPRPDLTELLDAVAAGRFEVPVDVVFPLAEAAEAHRYLERRANRGKVLLNTGA